MPRIQIKRGTRSQLDTAASNSELYQGEPYLITDSESMGVAVANNRYVEMSTLMISALERTYYYIDTSGTYLNLLCSMMNSNNTTNLDSFGWPSNYIQAVPFYTSIKFSISEIGVNFVSIGGTVNVFVALYDTYINQNFNGLPHPYQKIQEVYIGAINSTGLKTANFNFTFIPNKLYWWVVRLSGGSGAITTVGIRRYMVSIYQRTNVNVQLLHNAYINTTLTSLPNEFSIGSLTLDNNAKPIFIAGRVVSL